MKKIIMPVGFILMILVVCGFLLNQGVKDFREQRSQKLQYKQALFATNGLTDQAVTIGDNSYIPINLAGSTLQPEMVERILLTVDEFQRKNPGRRIVSWSVEKTQAARDASAEVRGIWIHHESKTSRK